MKILIHLAFILLASSTYRCAEDEITIDCTQATSDMVGTWKGKLNYTNSQANGARHNITLSIISTNGCQFQGISAFDEAGTAFVVSGTKGAASGTSSGNNPCNQWPYVRWRPGVKYHEARFRFEPLILQGKFFSAGGWRSGAVNGNYQIVKQ